MLKRVRQIPILSGYKLKVSHPPGCEIGKVKGWVSEKREQKDILLSPDTRPFCRFLPFTMPHTRRLYGIRSDACRFRICPTKAITVLSAGWCRWPPPTWHEVQAVIKPPAGRNANPEAWLLRNRRFRVDCGTGHRRRKKRTGSWRTGSFFSFVVTRTGIEPMFPAWEASVLTAWPTGHFAQLEKYITNWTNCQHKKGKTKGFFLISGSFLLLCFLLCIFFLFFRHFYDSFLPGTGKDLSSFCLCLRSVFFALPD